MDATQMLENFKFLNDDVVRNWLDNYGNDVTFTSHAVNQSILSTEIIAPSVEALKSSEILHEFLMIPIYYHNGTMLCMSYGESPPMFVQAVKKNPKPFCIRAAVRMDSKDGIFVAAKSHYENRTILCLNSILDDFVYTEVLVFGKQGALSPSHSHQHTQTQQPRQNQPHAIAPLDHHHNNNNNNNNNDHVNHGITMGNTGSTGTNTNTNTNTFGGIGLGGDTLSRSHGGVSSVSETSISNPARHISVDLGITQGHAEIDVDSSEAAAGAPIASSALPVIRNPFSESNTRENSAIQSSIPAPIAQQSDSHQPEVLLARMREYARRDCHFCIQRGDECRCPPSMRSRIMHGLLSVGDSEPLDSDPMTQWASLRHRLQRGLSGRRVTCSLLMSRSGRTLAEVNYCMLGNDFRAFWAGPHRNINEDSRRYNVQCRLAWTMTMKNSPKRLLRASVEDHSSASASLPHKSTSNDHGPLGEGHVWPSSKKSRTNDITPTIFQGDGVLHEVFNGDENEADDNSGIIEIDTRSVAIALAKDTKNEFGAGGLNPIKPCASVDLESTANVIHGCSVSKPKFVPSDAPISAVKAVLGKHARDGWQELNTDNASLARSQNGTAGFGQELQSAPSAFMETSPNVLGKAAQPPPIRSFPPLYPSPNEEANVTNKGVFGKLAPNISHDIHSDRPDQEDRDSLKPGHSATHSSSNSGDGQAGKVDPWAEYEKRMMKRLSIRSVTAAAASGGNGKSASNDSSVRTAPGMLNPNMNRFHYPPGSQQPEPKPAESLIPIEGVLAMLRRDEQTRSKEPSIVGENEQSSSGLPAALGRQGSPTSQTNSIPGLQPFGVANYALRHPDRTPTAGDTGEKSISSSDDRRSNLLGNPHALAVGMIRNGSHSVFPDSLNFSQSASLSRGNTANAPLSHVGVVSAVHVVHSDITPNIVPDNQTSYSFGSLSIPPFSPHTVLDSRNFALTGNQTRSPSFSSHPAMNGVGMRGHYVHNISVRQHLQHQYQSLSPNLHHHYGNQHMLGTAGSPQVANGSSAVPPFAERSPFMSGMQGEYRRIDVMTTPMQQGLGVYAVAQENQASFQNAPSNNSLARKLSNPLETNISRQYSNAGTPDILGDATGHDERTPYFYGASESKLRAHHVNQDRVGAPCGIQQPGGNSFPPYGPRGPIDNSLAQHRMQQNQSKDMVWNGNGESRHLAAQLANTKALPIGQHPLPTQQYQHEHQHPQQPAQTFGSSGPKDFRHPQAQNVALGATWNSTAGPSMQNASSSVGVKRESVESVVVATEVAPGVVVGAASAGIGANAADADSSLICPHCGIRSSRKSNLKRHIEMKHMGIRNFHCEHCDASFHLKQHLETHIRIIHQKDRPHMCSVCKQQFSTSSNMRKHLKSVHDITEPVSGSLMNASSTA